MYLKKSETVSPHVCEFMTALSYVNLSNYSSVTKHSLKCVTLSRQCHNVSLCQIMTITAFAVLINSLSVTSICAHLCHDVSYVNNDASLFL